MAFIETGVTIRFKSGPYKGLLGKVKSVIDDDSSKVADIEFSFSQTVKPMTYNEYMDWRTEVVK